MTWETKTFEELEVGDVLTSCGGYNWTVKGLKFLLNEPNPHEVLVNDPRSGAETWFLKQRDYWRFLVEKEEK